MGREAVTQAEVGPESGAVKVLLESDALILRGAIRRRYPRDGLAEVLAEAGVLRLRCDGEAVALHLGEPAAERWRVAILKPLPTVREKLELRGPVLLVGVCDDAALEAALGGLCTDDPTAASIIVACIQGAADLAAALDIPQRLPIWAVYPKGKAAAFGDAAIRTALRSAGYRDSKSCSVSAQRTATRYHPGR